MGFIDGLLLARDAAKSKPLLDLLVVVESIAALRQWFDLDRVCISRLGSSRRRSINEVRSVKELTSEVDRQKQLKSARLRDEL